MLLTENIGFNFSLSAFDALGKNAIDGKILFTDDKVKIDYRKRADLFAKTGNFTSLELEYADISSIKIKTRWFGSPSLIINFINSAKLKEMPLEEIGMLKFTFDKDKMASAQKVISYLELKQSEELADKYEDKFKRSKEEI